MTTAKPATPATTLKTNSQISTLEDAVTETAAPEAQTVVAENHDANLGGTMEIVTIHSGSEDGGSDAVLVIHNGYARQIPRDKPCKIPAEVAQVLRDAVYTSYKSGQNGAVTERSTPRYAMSSVPA